MFDRTFRKVVAFILVLICSVVSADELSIEETQQIEKLIAALASRNPVPKEGEGGPKGRMIYPLGYDLEAEKIPYRVAKQLAELGPKAFPMLMQHSKGKTFSCVREAPSGGMKIISVGTVCERIIAVQLNVYDSVAVYPASGPDYFDTEVRGKKFTAWWEQHQSKTLRDMQIEAFEWVIQEQQKLIEDWKPRAKANESHLSSGESYTELLSRQKESRRKNKQQLKKLRKAEEPLPFDIPIRKYHP